MKVIGTREENLQAFAKAYIDAKNGDARVLLIVLRPRDEDDGVLSGEIISTGLNDMEAAKLCSDVFSILIDDEDERSE